MPSPKWFRVETEGYRMSDVGGILCPECGRQTSVIDSRRVEGKTQGQAPRGVQSIRRRRKCDCGNRFTTYETILDEGILERYDMLETRIEALEAVAKGDVLDDQYQWLDGLRQLFGMTDQELSLAAGFAPGWWSKLRSTGCRLSRENMAKALVGLSGRSGSRSIEGSLAMPHKSSEPCSSTQG